MTTRAAAVLIEPVAESSGAPRRWWEAEVWVYALAAVGSLAATFFSLRLWLADLRVPFVYWGDAVAVGAHFKTVIETGWYEYQPLLGAPDGQHYHDFPTADNLNFAAARVLGWFTSDFAVAMNLYYVLGFVLSGVTMVWFLRECRVSKALTVALAVLFAIAPYHFIRGEGHLWLASYFTLPLALVVVLRATRGEPLWGARPGPRRLVGLASGRGASTFMSLALVATASSYYGVFVVILLATAGIVAWWRDRDLRRFVGAAVAGIVVVVTVVLNMLPDVLYTRAHGVNPAGLVRNAADVEVYALKLSQLLLPVPGHRVDFLARLRQHYDSTYPLVSERPALGAAAAFGLVCLLIIAVVQLASRRSGHGAALLPVQEARTRNLAALAMLTLVAFLCSTVGGLATLLSFLTSSLRGWNRMSIVIAALCLAATGLVLDSWVERLVRARQLGWLPARVVAGTLALVVLVGGTLDQVTPGAAPDYLTSASEFAEDATWVATIERSVPAGSMVFQLPVAGFPETGPVNGVWDTDQLKPYLHSDTLRWSGAGVKGRSTSDWSAVLAAQPAEAMVTGLAAAGFAAIVVDRQALGGTADDVEAQLTVEAGPPAERSADGRFALYLLADARAALALHNSAADIAEVAESVIRPVLAYPGVDVAATLGDDGDVAWLTSGGPDGEITLDSGGSGDVDVRLTSAVTTADGSAEVTITVGGEVLQVSTTGGAGSLDAVVTVEPGQTDLTVLSSGGGPVTLTDFAVEVDGLPALSR